MKNTNNEFITKSGLIVSMPVNGIVRVTDGKHNNSYAVCAEMKNIAPEQKNGKLTWGDITVETENGMALYYNGKCLCKDYDGQRKPDAPMLSEAIEQLLAEGHIVNTFEKFGKVEVVKELVPDAVIYGLGDKTGFLNKRHYTYINWNTDDPSPHCDNYLSLYKSINFFMVYSADGCVGILADNTYSTWFDFGKEQNDYYFWSHAGGNLDYYMIPGKTPKDVLLKYLTLTGKSELQQKWVYGFHQSRWSYFSSEEMLNVVENMKKNNLPIDAIHFDIDYMDGYRVFTFDKKRFSDPKALTKALSEKGVKAVTIIDPGVKKDDGYFMYDEGIKDGHFAKNPDGTVYEGKVWPGETVFPDFTQEKTRNWWADKISILTESGVRGIWNDMNEPANFTGDLPDDVQFSEGSHAEIHNVFGHLMNKATYDGLKKADGRRPFVLTRACYAGTQRYASGWTGDNHSMWQHLQLSLTQMMNLGLSGVYNVGSDVGGFGSDTTPELMIRWSQLGAISPFFRNHSEQSSKHQEFYCFDEKTVDMCRESLDLRYHLLPYIYDIAHEDLPILRPLVLEYPNDPVCKQLTDQCMLGDRLLCAPVMTPGVSARAVYLPEGEWYDYYTGEKHIGGKYVLAAAPLNRMPMFAKAGAVIPVSKGKPQNTDEITEEYLEFFPGNGKYVHYIDDGESYDYLDGGIRTIEITVDGTNVCQSVTSDGYDSSDELETKLMA